jgi:hypothetical protein
MNGTGRAKRRPSGTCRTRLVSPRIPAVRGGGHRKTGWTHFERAAARPAGPPLAFPSLAFLAPWRSFSACPAEEDRFAPGWFEWSTVRRREYATGTGEAPVIRGHSRTFGLLCFFASGASLRQKRTARPRDSRLSLDVECWMLNVGRSVFVVGSIESKIADARASSPSARRAYTPTGEAPRGTGETSGGTPEPPLKTAAW